MGCKEVMRLFPDYLDGALDSETLRGFEAHLDECVFCRKLLEGYRRAISLFQEAHLSEMPAEVSERLKAFLSENLKF